MREGQGSYFHAQKNKLFVGEYVEDIPKAGIYTEVADGSTGLVENGPEKLRDFDDIPPIPELGLRDPVGVLEEAFKRTRLRRIFYRARFMGIAQMFQKAEVEEMLNQFCVYGGGPIAAEQALLLLERMGIEIEPEKLPEFVGKVVDQVPPVLDFELFARTVAVILEENNKLPEELVDDYDREEDMQEN